MIIKIKDAIPELIKPTHKYKIHIKSMHSDADAYTTQTKLVETREDVKKYIKFLSTVWTMKGDEYDDGEVRKAIREAAEELGIEGHGEDVWMDLVDLDQTNDQNYAYVDEIWVTYFNSHGIEFNCDVVLKGKNKDHNRINKYIYTGKRF